VKGQVPEALAAALREWGPVIDVARTKALYAPLLAQQPREGVRSELDRIYGDHARHRLDVYAPSANVDAPLPAIVFVHGGGFIRGDKSERANVGIAFARHGFVVIVPNYRLAPEHRWPAGAQDVARVLEWATANAAALGVDPRHIMLLGESAGAAHAAAATLIRSLQPAAHAMPLAVALISGPYNARLEGLAHKQFGIAQPDPRNEAYFGSDRAAWDGMSIVDRVDAIPMPLLISYAELDPAQMQVQAGELFARLVSRHGFDPALVVVREHNHLSQLYSIGTGDPSLEQPLLDWMRGIG
jgi:acetyl esterase